MNPLHCENGVVRYQSTVYLLIDPSDSERNVKISKAQAMTYVWDEMAGSSAGTEKRFPEELRVPTRVGIICSAVESARHKWNTTTFSIPGEVTRLFY